MAFVAVLPPNCVTVMVPGVTAPVISLQLTATALTTSFGKVTATVTTEVASLTEPSSNWMVVATDAVVAPLQLPLGVTEKIALGCAPLGPVRASVEPLVCDSVSPPPGVTGTTRVAVALPVRFGAVTVMVPATTAPVSSLHVTPLAVVAEKVLVACAVPARHDNATSAKSAFDPLVFITDKSIEDRPFLMVFSTALRGGGLVIWPLQALSARVRECFSGKS
jgi:hypothetical protein